MTLVSYTSNFGNPILMADLLITSRERNRNAQIPAFLGPVEDAMPPEHLDFPYELKQKIYVIKDNLAVGLAGNVYQMTLFLQDIKAYFNYYPATQENVEAFMQDYDPGSLSGCSVIIMIPETSEECTINNVFAHGTWEQYADKWLERGLITGTGTAAFFKRLNVLNPLIKKEDTNGHRGFNINLISLFMAEESYTMETIMEAWGAGFEVIEYTGTKFRKLDNLTYIVCHTEYDSQAQTVENTPFLVMHYTYHEEILLINTYSNGQFMRYGVLPLDIKKENFDLDSVPAYNGFESQQVVCVFVIEKPNGGHYMSSVLTHSQSDEFTIKASFCPPAPAYLQVEIDQKISESIAREYSQLIHNASTQ